MKSWITKKAKNITNGLTDKFTGIKKDQRIWVHFATFSVPLDVCDKYNSFDELLENILN